MAGYRTKQRELILDYLKSTGQSHVSAADIAAHLREKEAVGLATVYRQLDKMVEDGLVRKYSLDGGACYQYVGGGDGCHEHFHLKCLGCGALLHVDCDFLSGLGPHILEHHGFQVDNSRTVMYGLCVNCRKDAEDGQ